LIQINGYFGLNGFESNPTTDVNNAPLIDLGDVNMKKLIGSSIVAIAAALSFSGSASAADVQSAKPVVQEAQSPWFMLV